MEEDELKAYLAAIVVSQARLYDVLLMMFKEMNPEEAVALREAHKKGLLYAPPPAYQKEE